MIAEIAGLKPIDPGQDASNCFGIADAIKPCFEDVQFLSDQIVEDLVRAPSDSDL